MDARLPLSALGPWQGPHSPSPWTSACAGMAGWRMMP